MPTSDLRTAARDYVWLYDRRRGLTVREISRRSGVSESTVRAGLRRAEEADGGLGDESSPASLEWGDHDPLRRLIPIFPMAALTPLSECPHRDPIPYGSRFICMVCHASGLDEGAAPAKPRDRAASRSRPDRAGCRADVA